MSVERSTNYKVEVDLTEEEYALLYLLVNAPENAILGALKLDRIPNGAGTRLFVKIRGEKSAGQAYFRKLLNEESPTKASPNLASLPQQDLSEIDLRSQNTPEGWVTPDLVG